MKAIQEGIFSASLGKLQSAISEALLSAGEELLNDSWRPDRQASEVSLRGQLELLALWLRGGVFDQATGRKLAEQQRALDALLGAARRDESATQRLAAAGDHPAIRFALLTALIERGELAKAKTLGENLLRGDTTLSQSGRLRAVMAFIELREQRESARGLERMREALFVQESW